MTRCFSTSRPMPITSCPRPNYLSNGFRWSSGRGSTSTWSPTFAERSADGTILLGFYHRQLREVVEADYLSGDAGRDRHRALATYFAGQELDLTTNGALLPNLRKLAELPYQQTRGELWDDLFATLTDFRFLERKAATGEL